MTIPALVQLKLPSGKVLRVCETCGLEPPAHNYYCPAVNAWPRSRVLRAMVAVEDRIRELQAQLVRPAPSQRIAAELFLARNAFWDWAKWIGFDLDRDMQRLGLEGWRAARDDVRAEVDEMRRRINRRKTEDAAA